MKKYIALLFFLCSVSLYAEQVKKPRVEIVTYSKSSLPLFLKLKTDSCLNDSYDIRIQHDLYRYVQESFEKKFPQKLDASLRKIVFIDYCEDKRVFQLPTNKMILFKWEAIKINPFYYAPYSVVYTVDDDLVDGKKFFKFFYPVLKPMLDQKEQIPFDERKFLVMIASNIIDEKKKILDFFATKPKGELDFYGRVVGPLTTHPTYRGEALNKNDLLKQYRFCICWENTHTVKGYITEKIFDCFAAGCVPIYWGPSNVETYIPKNCFIDYRNFRTDEELYLFLKTMPRNLYEQYVENIRSFLQSDKAKLFSFENFAKSMSEAVDSQLVKKRFS